MKNGAVICVVLRILDEDLEYVDGFCRFWFWLLRFIDESRFLLLTCVLRGLLGPADEFSWPNHKKILTYVPAPSVLPYSTDLYYSEVVILVISCALSSTKQKTLHTKPSHTLKIKA